jgi:hypothetical protein
MSQLIVEIKKIDAIKSHPNADKLEVVEIGGWQVCAQKNTFKKGELVIYVPPDTIIPNAIAEQWGVKAYLSKGERVKCVKLRGEPSFGFIIPREDPSWSEGYSVVEHYGLTKYIPRPPRQSGGSVRGTHRIADHPLFVKYTDIDNLRHYPNVLQQDEEVIVCEKVHGTSSRVAIIDGQFMGGSRNYARSIPYLVNKLPYTWNYFKTAIKEFRWGDLFRFPKELKLDIATLERDAYLIPFSIPGVVDLLEHLGRQYKQVILFGETYGPTQYLHYGSPDKLQYGAYDIMLDGKYIDRNMFIEYCEVFKIPNLPFLYRGPYNIDTIRTLANKNTIVGSNANQISEGVVVRPIQERTHPKCGRVIFKYISDAYLLKQEENREMFDVANDESEAPGN